MKTFKNLALLAALVGISGCGGSEEEHPEVVPVSGTVMYNGSPIAGATVSFWAEGAPRPATGVTGSDGKFQLSMFAANDGALPGENKITVAKMDAAAAAPPTSSSAPPSDPVALTQGYRERMDTSSGADSGPESLIPTIYADQATTPLKETVSATGENTFVLQLAD